MAYEKALESIILPSAARTATPTMTAAADFTDLEGLAVIVDITAVTATPAVTVAIEGFDVASGAWVTILASTALAVIARTLLAVYPGLTDVANSRSGIRLPRRVRVTATHGDADSATYSLGAWVWPCG